MQPKRRGGEIKYASVYDKKIIMDDDKLVTSSAVQRALQLRKLAVSVRMRVDSEESKD